MFISVILLLGLSLIHIFASLSCYAGCLYSLYCPVMQAVSTVYIVLLCRLSPQFILSCYEGCLHSLYCPVMWAVSTVYIVLLCRLSPQFVLSCYAGCLHSLYCPVMQAVSTLCIVLLCRLSPQFILSCYAGCLHSLYCPQGFIFKYFQSVFRQSIIHITVCMTSSGATGVGT